MRHMKIYEIINEEDSCTVGFLLYYEKEKNYITELVGDLDEWNAPLLFSNLVKQGIYTVPRDLSLLWVKERIIPPTRQNISAILANHKLNEYDEIKFLEISEGRCSQDSLRIKKMKEIPDLVRKRQEKNLACVFPTGENRLLCFFADDTVKRVDLNKLMSEDGVEKVIKNRELFLSATLGSGGCYVTFNDSIDVPARCLYSYGEDLGVKRADFLDFLRWNVLDTKDVCNLLSCSRQNVSYLTKQKDLSPVKENVMGNLYLKEDVLRTGW